MANDELILQELKKMNQRLDSMDKHMDRMEGKIDTLTESHEETRSGVNSLLEWAEECGNMIKFPLPKVR